jgi:hypothetical protein
VPRRVSRSISISVRTDTYDDPKLRCFAERVEVRAEPNLHGVATLVDVETIGGDWFSAHCDQPLGAPENKLSRSQIEAKFRTYAPGRLSHAHIEDVIGAVVRLEHQLELGECEFPIMQDRGRDVVGGQERLEFRFVFREISVQATHVIWATFGRPPALHTKPEKTSIVPKRRGGSTRIRWASCHQNGNVDALSG